MSRTAGVTPVLGVGMNRNETLLAFASTLYNTVAYYIALIYMASYMTTVGKLAQGTVLWITTGCLAVMIVPPSAQRDST